MLFCIHNTQSIHIKYRAEARGLIVLTAGASQVSLSISAERQLTIVNSSDKHAKNKNKNARRNGVNNANKQLIGLFGLAQSRDRPLDDLHSDIVAKKASLRGSRLSPAGKALGEVSVSTRCITPCGEERRQCQIVDIVVARSSIRLTESCVTPAEEILPESRATEAPPMRKMKKNAEGDAFVDLFSPKRMSVVNSTQTIGVNDGYNEVVKNEDNVRIADLSKSSRIESQSAIRDGPDRSRVNLEIDTGLRAHLGNENWTNRKFESPRTPSSGPLLFIRLIEKGGEKLWQRQEMAKRKCMLDIQKPHIIGLHPTERGIEAEFTASMWPMSHLRP